MIREAVRDAVEDGRWRTLLGDVLLLAMLLAAVVAVILLGDPVTSA